MSNKTKPALVPKLRFPEFDDNWEMTPIGGKIDLLSGYPFDGPEISQDSSGIRLLRGINITEGKIRHSPDIDRYYTGETNGMEKFRVRVNDLVIGMDGSKVGKNSALISDNDADALLIQRVARLRTTSPTLIQFIFQQINSTTFHSYVDKINTSSGIPHISAKQIKDFTIGFPSPAEQQKIAECLSSVDDLIAAQAQKVDALKTHKKGLMQQLFPCEGETQPRIRFPEFRDAEGWERKRLKHLATYTKGFPFKSQDYIDEGIRIIRVSDLGTDFIKSDNEKIYIDSKSAQIYERYRLRKDEIIITTVGSKPELIDSAVGRGIRVTQSDEGLLNQNLLKLEVLPSTSSMFLFCNINTELYQKFIISISRGNANQANIAVKELMDFEVTAPTLPEQQRIADCLTSLDDLIAAQTQKLAALKTHKQGLMQQLFPASAAVAG